MGTWLARPLLALLSAGTPAPTPAIPVARIAVVGAEVQQSETGRDWRAVPDGAAMKTGDRVRVGAGSVARVEFPWMFLTASPGAQIAIPAGTVLSTVLEAGRVEVKADAGEIIKLKTAEAQIRGQGRAVVRREGDVTRLSVLEGSFRVEQTDAPLTIEAGHGAILTSRRPPELHPLPSAPGKLVPGADPVYVRAGTAAALQWSAASGPYHVQVLQVDADEVLLEQDVAAAPASFAVPWLGTFRWHVARRDEHGLEGPASPFGFFCFVEK